MEVRSSIIYVARYIDKSLKYWYIEIKMHVKIFDEKNMNLLVEVISTIKIR